MARLSTLPLRIDRVLDDQVISCRVSQWQWATLMLGVAAVSLTIANFAPSIASKPVATSSKIREIESAKPTQDALPSTSLLPDKTLERKILIPNSVAPSAARPQQARVAVRPLPTTKNMISPPTSRAQQVTKVAPGFQNREASPARDVVDQRKTETEPEQARNVAAAKSSPVGQKSEILYPRDTVSAPLRANVERLNGSTCVGTVAVGQGAYYSGGQLLEPNVTAGQVVPARAQFFQKPDGTSWVRFGSFDRPPLDLKVQPTRTGVTWTGEYGITYAVQEAGADHFVGLAARVANDSATLSFTCKK